MRLPRDLGGEALAALLQRYGYEITRQTGSHMRLTTLQEGEHHITIPRHPSLRVGTIERHLEGCGSTPGDRARCPGEITLGKIDDSFILSAVNG